jgi:hypothetical protein
MSTLCRVSMNDCVVACILGEQIGTDAVMAELVGAVEKITEDACAAGAEEDVRIVGQLAVAAVKQAHYDAVAKIEKARLDAIAQKQVRHFCSATARCDCDCVTVTVNVTVTVLCIALRTNRGRARVRRTISV